MSAVNRLMGARAYLAAILFTTIGFFVRLALSPLLGDSMPVMTFFPAIMASTWLGGYYAGLLSITLSGFLALRFFVPPYNSMIPETVEAFVGMSLYFVIGLLTAKLVDGYWSTRLQVRVSDRNASLSRARLAELLESIDDGFVAVSPDWRFTWVNRRAGELIDKPGSLTAGAFWEEFPAFAREPAAAVFRAAMTDRVPGRAEVFDDRTGRWLEGRVFPSADGGVTVYLTDISERRAAEQQVRHARKQTEDILSSIQESFLVLDRNWRYVWINRRVADSLRREPEEILGRHLFELTPEARGTAFETGFERVRAEGTPQHFEVDYKPDNRWFEVHAYPTEDGGIAAYVLDITERRDAELSLRSREAELTAIMDNAPVLVSHIGVDGRYRRINQRYREFFGDDVVRAGTHIREVAGNEHWTRIQALFQRATAGEPVTYDASVNDREGRLHDFQVTLTPLPPQSGQSDGVIALAVDTTERNRAEATLRSSEERYRFLAEGIPQLVWTRGTDGNIDYVNRHWITYTGWKPEESQGDRWLELAHPEDRAVLAGAMNERRSGRPYEVEVRLRRASDGAWRWHLMRGLYLPDRNGELHWIATAVDIHDRKESEFAVRASEKRYSTLASAMPAVVWSADSAGNMTWISERWTEYTGRSAQASVGDAWVAQLHPDDRHRVSEAWQAACAAGTPFELEYRILDRHGNPRWFLGRGLPVQGGEGAMQWIGTCTDIDARRQAEEALLHTNHTLTAFIRACPLAVTVLDPDGTIRLWNPAAEALYGWSEAEAIGRFHPAIPQERHATFRDNLQTVLNGNPLLGVETARVRKDGSAFVAQGWTAAVTARDGGQQVISIVADVTERLRAEATIRETEQRFRTMADQAPVLVWVVDTDRQFLWVNKPWLEFTGRNPLSEYGEGWLEGVHLDDRAQWHRACDNAWDRREPFSIEFRLLRHDGEFRWILGRGVPLLAEDGTFNGYIGSCIDITERRHAEVALKESEARLRIALSAAEMATWDWDLATDTVTWSRNLAEMSGMSENPADYDAAMSSVHPDDLPRVEAAIAASLGGGAPYECEYRSVQPDGTVRWILGKGHVVRDASGSVIRLTGVALDVTARREADQNLRASEERLRMAKEAAELGIWDWDLKTNETRWSPEIYQFLGVEPGPEVPTLDFWKTFAHPDDCARVIAEAARSVQTGEPVASEFRITRADGSLRWLMTRGRPVYDEHGTPVRMIGVNMDITERRLTEEKLRQTNAELEQYAFAASHDLQEPLRIVMLYSQLLTRRYGDRFDGEAKSHFENITNSAARMQMLIDDLLSYSRILAEGERKLGPVDMNSVLTVALEACKAAVDETSCTLSAETELPVVQGDYNALVGVLQNLISNAVKYRRSDVRPDIRVSAVREPDHWHFIVRDNGIGIRPVYHQRIFGVFKRLHGREVPGTGIGLAICKRTVEQHGGLIWVESDEGQGSAFHFTLPAFLPESADAATSG